MRSILSNNCIIGFKAEGFRLLNKKLLEKNYTSIFILVDSNTEKHCLHQFLRLLDGNLSFETLVIEAGESNKNLETCERLWRNLSEGGSCDRKSALINLGGGVVTDLGGFVASTFKRGIDFFNIPTTLLSMVDASVGGKTGVNLRGLKNQIGVIIDPLMVVIEPSWLETLPDREFKNGLAEMLKHGLIADATYWKKLSRLKTLSTQMSADHIFNSIVIKNKVVTQDPREEGLRKILNFGHTLGHAIESHFLADKEALLHGEAIAAGIVLETYLSTTCLGFPIADAEKIKTVFKSLYNLIAFDENDISNILNMLQYDKKNIRGKINFVLLEDIGLPKIDIQVPFNLFQKAFDFYRG